MSENVPPCPKCASVYSYQNDSVFVCPECNHEWNQEETESITETNYDRVIKDANGVILQNGDSVIIIKDLPVKGAAKAIKTGTKVKNIRLTDGDHNIDCKIDGFGAMALKSEFVKKV